MLDMQKKENYLLPLIDLWVMAYFIGLVCSKALLSVGMVGFCGTALWLYIKDKDLSTVRITPFLFPVLLFVITLISGFFSIDKTIWMDFVMKKAPFLILPFAFYAVRSKVAYRYHDYLMAFVILVSIVSLGVLANYIMNFELMNEAIGKGKAIKTPIDHTEFSIYVAFAAIVSLFNYLDKTRVAKIGTKGTQFLLFIFLVLFLHILAVRSGLAVFYGTGLVMGCYYFVTEKKFKFLLLFLVGMLVLPLVGIKVVPSLKKKFDYVNWDLHRYRVGKGLNHSDSERLYSLKVGLDIFKKNKLMGTGIGDLKAECQQRYTEQHGQALKHYPHNQYIFILAGMGIIGFIFYCISLLGPLIYFRGFFDPYLLCLYGVVFISAFVENTLERTFSIGFYLFFVLTYFCYTTHRWAQQK